LVRECAPQFCSRTGYVTPKRKPLSHSHSIASTPLDTLYRVEGLKAPIYGTFLFT